MTIKIFTAQPKLASISYKRLSFLTFGVILAWCFPQIAWPGQSDQQQYWTRNDKLRSILQQKDFWYFEMYRSLVWDTFYLWKTNKSGRYKWEKILQWGIYRRWISTSSIPYFVPGTKSSYLPNKLTLKLCQAQV